MEHAASLTVSKPCLGAILASAVAILPGFAIGCTQLAGQTSMAGGRLEAEMAAQLPPGTTANAVDKWLTLRNLEHLGLIDNARLAHMGADPATFEIKAILRSEAAPALVRTDTQLTFTFDRDRRLLSTRVNPVHTGL